MVILYGLIFVESLVISAVIIPLMMRLAIRWNVLDEVGERKVHRTAKPLLGGVAILIGFFVTVIGNVAAFSVCSRSEWFVARLPALLRFYPYLNAVLPKLTVILAGGFLMHLLGLADDIWKERLSVRFKFLVQILIISGVALAGVRVEFMPYRWLDLLITIVWIVGMTNSFNLLDNMDGLTAGVSIICGGLLFVIAVLQAQVFFAFLLAALAGGCLGFLFYNFYPSRLFMGDSGSLFLGYMFGVLTVTGSYVVPQSVSHIPIVVPILVLSIPLYDTFSVIFIRWREKRPLFVGDKKHFSHRLVELGMTHRGAVIFIYLVSLCVGLVALMLPYISREGMIVVLVQSVIIYILITILISVGTQNQDENRIP